MTGELTAPNNKVRSMHPHRFAMWLFLVTVIMIFIALSSAYIVKKSMSDWQYIDFPNMFKWTSVIIVLSSVSMHFAYLSAKKNNIKNIRISLIVTSVLAITFVVGQFMAWGQLVADHNYFSGGNAASSFIYVFTGLHLVHLAGAIIFLIVVLSNSFQYKIHSKNLLRIELCTTFWHFLGGLWIYLYLFLIFNN